MVQRIVNVGGFISVIPHQGGRSRIRDLSSAYGTPSTAGTHRRRGRRFTSTPRRVCVVAIGIGSDFNGFAGVGRTENRPRTRARRRPRRILTLPTRTHSSTTDRCWTTTAIRCRNTRSAIVLGLQRRWPGTRGLPSRLHRGSSGPGPRRQAWSVVQLDRSVREDVEKIQTTSMRPRFTADGWRQLACERYPVPCNAHDVGWGLERVGRQLRARYDGAVRIRDQQRLDSARIRRFATPAVATARP